MKSVIVPAQITTVEDKIAGNLTLQQMVLLATPVFGNFLLYIVLPKSLHLSAYKLVLMVLMVFISWALAIRLKGKILLTWAVTIARYNARPRRYVFNKNDHYLRDIQPIVSDAPVSETTASVMAAETVIATPNMTTAEVVKLEDLLTNPAAKLSFKTRKKGGLYVCVTQVET